MNANFALPLIRKTLQKLLKKQELRHANQGRGFPIEVFNFHDDKIE
jgi:hypothetical protein